MSERQTFWNVRLIDGRGGPPVEHSTVTIEDGRIAAIGTAAGDPPSEAIDIAGRTLMPGLIDAHAHVSSDTDRSPGFGPLQALHGDDPRPRELGYFILANTARAMLHGGVTTVRDVGAYDGEAIVLRLAVELGLVEGPQILSCGRILSATSPGARIFNTMYQEADGPWQMRQAVRQQIKDGADYIKIMATGARSVVSKPSDSVSSTAE